MKQAVYVGARSFHVRAAEPAQPGPNEVCIAVAYTGLCGTDLHIYHGDMDARVAAPQVIGHEMSGHIATVGADVTGWRPGDPVTVMPLAWCGECPACHAGHRHICHRLNFIGIDSTGSMQESWVVPADTLVRLPDDLALGDAALVEPTAVAVHDVRRAALRAGEKVVVVGGGPVGVLVAVVARGEGADVVVVEPDAFRRGVAESIGLTTLDPTSIDVVARVDEWTGGAGAAAAFEVSGAAAGITTAVDVLAVRGRLCLVAIHPRPREINLHRFFWRELTLVGARLYERVDYEKAVQLVASGVVPTKALISQVMLLGDVGAAFAALDSGAGVMKILLDCRAADSDS